MSPGQPPSDRPFDGDPSTDAALEQSLRSVTALAGGRFEVLGPLGGDRQEGYAFLARDLAADKLVVLKRDLRVLGGPGTTALKVIERLDSSVPPPAGACPVCQAPFSGWDPACPECGADIAGSIGVPGQGTSREELLEAVRQAAEGYEVLGSIPRAVGGASVYFAREPKGGTLVALRLEQENAPGRRSGLTVTATRMMRPKLLYGTVGGDPREPRVPSAGTTPWKPVPSTPPARARVGATPSGAPGSVTAGGAGEKICPQCGEVFGPEHRFCPRDGSTLRAKAQGGDLIGQVIAERYHILAKLGEGGMGRVYLAEHIRMGRRCAIKVMNPILSFDPDSVSRFNREAANASRITHPNVAAIYDFGETDDVVYLAMELVEGESLAAVLEREHGLPESRAIQIGLQVADALSAAHDLGIVHRDLKPDNIMLSRSRDGRDVVKVVDFGIAKATKGGRQTVTRTGYVVGTPAYMSPEQILGDTLDGRSDLYSLGCILYEMLTGERAFADPTGEVSIRLRLTEPPPRPSRVKRGLRGELDAVVTTAMARAPENRFQSAAQLREALTAAAKESGSWLGWLPWKRPRAIPTASPASTGSDRSRTAPDVSYPPRAPSGAIPPAAAPVQPMGTAPVPVGWEEEVHPPVRSVARGTTVLRDRPTQRARRILGWVAAGCVAVGLGAVGVWRLAAPRSQRDADARNSKIVLPSPKLPSIPGKAPIGNPPIDKTPPGKTPVPAPSSSDSTSVSAPASPAYGTVRFADELPPGATVTVDGKETSLSIDGSLSVPPGSHTIRVDVPGYRPTSQVVKVASAQTDSVRVRLVPTEPVPEPESKRPAPAPGPKPVPAPTTGTVLVTGDLPQGAEISLDGVIVPAGTREFPARPGIHWLRVSAEGYRPDSSQIEVKAGGESRVEVPRLAPMPAPEPVVHVKITTPDTTIQTGATLQLRFEVKDESGAHLDRPLVWESSNSAFVRVEQNGRVTALGPGRVYVRARGGSASDSAAVTVVPAPKPAPVARDTVHRPEAPETTAPPTPTVANVQAAIAACGAALGSGDERRIVNVYQAETAQDVVNLRKILDLALRKGAELTASEVKVGAPAPPTPQKVEYPLQVQFTWRNNAGVGKKKEIPFRLELTKGRSEWRLASCRATEKVGF
jgi:serine/threonine protein kinase